MKYCIQEYSNILSPKQKLFKELNGFNNLSYLSHFSSKINLMDSIMNNLEKESYNITGAKTKFE